MDVQGRGGHARYLTAATGAYVEEFVSVMVQIRGHARYLAVKTGFNVMEFVSGMVRRVVREGCSRGIKRSY
jgi:hypothetical protein